MDELINQTEGSLYLGLGLEAGNRLAGVSVDPARGLHAGSDGRSEPSRSITSLSVTLQRDKAMCSPRSTRNSNSGAFQATLR
jgi:hypothetical protein